MTDKQTLREEIEELKARIIADPQAGFHVGEDREDRFKDLNAKLDRMLASKEYWTSLSDNVDKINERLNRYDLAKDSSKGDDVSDASQDEAKQEQRREFLESLESLEVEIYTPPIRDRKLLRFVLPRDEYDEAIGDLEEAYLRDCREFDETTAQFYYRQRMRGYILETIFRRGKSIIFGVVGYFFGSAG